MSLNTKNASEHNHLAIKAYLIVRQNGSPCSLLCELYVIDVILIYVRNNFRVFFFFAIR